MMKNRVIIVAWTLFAFTSVQTTMAKSTEDFGVKNCENSDIKIMIDKPCQDCEKTLKMGESAIFTMPKRERPVIHVTDVNGKVKDFKPGLLENPLGMPWYYWDGKEITTRKGKCD